MFKLGGDANQKEISDPFLSVAIKVREESESDLSYFIDELLKERAVFPQWVNEVPDLVGEFKVIAAQIRDQQIDKILREYLNTHQR
jgi:hypothetical protein